MDIIELIKKNVKVGDVLQNPGGGTSEIISFTETAIRYRRGNSDISLKYESINSAYENFKGQKVSASDLADFDIEFSERRHHCNATFFLMLMDKCELSKGGIQGEGIAGNPFYLDLK